LDSPENNFPISYLVGKSPAARIPGAIRGKKASGPLFQYADFQLIPLI